MNSTLDEFRQAITAAGLEAPDVIHDDGAIHRFSPGGRRGGLSGWYVLHSDSVAAGSFGCWREGLQSTWCAKSDNAMTAAERDAHRQRIKAMKAQRDADLLATQQQASEAAAALWSQADPATTHAYLVTKGVQSHGLKVFVDKLLVPLRDTAGKLHSLQTITPNGEKRFKGRMKGCYHPIGRPAGRIIVCEGYATGASIHEATGDAVAVAFNSGNVGLVAMALHKAYPSLCIVIGCDDDHLTPGNPGLTAARQAALAVGGFVVVPQFPADRPPKATDFNDLAALAGLSAVRACFSEIEVLSC